MKKIFCFVLTLGLLISSLQGAVVVQFSSNGAPEDESLPVRPEYVIGQSVNASNLDSYDDSLERLPGSLTYRGWDSTVNFNKYVGFTVRAESGYELHLTHLSFETASRAESRVSFFSEITSYAWAYRINDGRGYSAWNFGEWYVSSDPKNVPLTWDFEDVFTAGTVEFGLFATSNGGYADLSLGMVKVDGEVPEPSSCFLIAFSGSLALLRRNRKSPPVEGREIE